MRHDPKPPRQPLFWAAVALSLGLWTGVHEWRPPSWLVIASVAFGFAACWFLSRRAWAAKALSLGIWFLLGTFLIQVRSHKPNGLQRNEAEILALADGTSVVFTGHVIREGYPQSTYPGATHESIDVETEEIIGRGAAETIQAGVRLTIYDKDPAQSLPDAAQGARSSVEAASETLKLTYGTRLRIRAKLHPARNYRNPGAFDYEGYLRDNGITVLGSAEAKDIVRIPGFSGSRVELWRTRVHASIIAKIHQLWPAPQAALMDAMVLGEESFLRNATRTEYQRSGTYHVLVVSGMNLSILAIAIFWTLRQLRIDPALAAITTVVVSFGYAFIVGVGPPVWRAALMLATYLGARLLYRERNMMNAIGAAALGVLIVDPHALFGASFQLTFLAVFIIAGVGSPVLERSTLPYSRGLRLLRAASYDFHVAPQVAQFRLDLRLIAGRLARFIGDRLSLTLPAVAIHIAIVAAELIFISALMQTGLALLMAYHFHRATTMGMPANLAVIPLTQLLMPASAAAVGLGYISTTLAKPAVWISGIALEGIAGTVHRLAGAQVAGASIADLRVAMPSLAVIWASMAALMLAMLTARRARWAVVASVVLVFGVGAWIAFVPSRPHSTPTRWR
jgi:competence protein ComEC